MFSATFPTFPTFPTPNWCLHQSFTLYQQITCVLQFTKANQSTKMFIFVLCTLWVLPHPTCSSVSAQAGRMLETEETSLWPLIRYWVSSGLIFQELVFESPWKSNPAHGKKKEMCGVPVVYTGLCNEGKRHYWGCSVQMVWPPWL